MFSYIVCNLAEKYIAVDEIWKCLQGKCRLHGINNLITIYHIASELVTDRTVTHKL